jgi:6-pyruvoyltetrahydropterin/6-carboxytetrahydropterin synthase
MTIHLTRRYGFTALHRLHAPALSAEENRAVYGKCNNPHGHGHDYQVELVVAGPVDGDTGRVVDLAALDRLAEEQVLTPFGHKDLNRQIPAFRDAVPTTENVASEVSRRLRAAWNGYFPAGLPRLEKVRIHETGRNICEITENYE